MEAYQVHETSVMEAYQVPTHRHLTCFDRPSTTPAASEHGEGSDKGEAAGGASALRECSGDLMWGACPQVEAGEEGREEVMGRQDCGGSVGGTWAVKHVEAVKHVVACGRDANAKRPRNPREEKLAQLEHTDMAFAPAARAHAPCCRAQAEAGAGLQARGKKRRHTHAHVQDHNGGGLMLGLFDGPASVISYMI